MGRVGEVKNWVNAGVASPVRWAIASLGELGCGTQGVQSPPAGRKCGLELRR